SAISSGSLLQSLPAAALSSCRMRHLPGCIRLSVCLCAHLSVCACLSGSVSVCLPLTLRSILAKPKALDARSLASWKSSLSDRLVSITDRLERQTPLSQNSSPLLCRPASRKSPVDFKSIPAMSLFPDCASPPRI
uniref:Uncharacterized protein n=1 Tax=Esox lucius TaxID=8010 RepID=A0A3P8Y6L6_ESOLU